MQGWIKLHRQIREHSLYQQKRRFSKFEAWIDLLLRANHKDTEILMDYKMEKVGAGEFITSEVQLAKDWQWNRKTVRKFLTMLESEEMVTKIGSPRWTRITITNWASYQSNGQPNGQGDGQGVGQAMDRGLDTDKNVKNEENVKEVKKDRVPYQEIADLYNEHCYNLPAVRMLTKGRKDKLQTRWEELGSIEEFKRVFKLANKSPFLCGKNDRGWKANFDWLITNDTNLTKVLEGRYNSEHKDSRPTPW